MVTATLRCVAVVDRYMGTAGTPTHSLFYVAVVIYHLYRPKSSVTCRGKLI